jgi:hypothetical protein
MSIYRHCTSGYDVETDLQPRHPYEGFYVVVKYNWADWSKIHALCLFTAISHDTELTNTEGSLSQAEHCHKSFVQNNN